MTATRPLTVLTVAFARAPVGADSVGGAEQIAAALDRALVEAGHRSLVVACRGSRVAGEWIDTGVAPGSAGDGAERATHAVVSAALDRYEVDLVHAHGLDFPATIPAQAAERLLATLHLPVSWYPPLANCPGRWLNCVSSSQQRNAPPDPRFLPPIPNGVPVARLAAAGAKSAPSPAPAGYALHLGRVCPEKGQHLALQAAHRAGVPLLLGGTVYPYPAHQTYFAEAVRPLLDAERRFLGPVGFDRKAALLAGARCLLVPSLAAETSSLVAMEAAACGTPVVAFRTGALPDIVEEGRSGLLVDDVEGMARAIGAVSRLDRDACRAVALERFDETRMSAAYLFLYRTLCDGRASAGAAA